MNTGQDAAYKFIDAEHVSNVMRGSLKLGSFSHYRAAENPQLRDEREGAQFHVQSRPIFGGDNWSPHDDIGIRNLEALGVVQKGQAPGVFADNVVATSAPASHIFCYSYGDYATLSKHWRTTGCLKIKNPASLAKHIIKHGRIVLNDERIRARKGFARLTYGQVRYDAADFDIAVNLNLPGPPSEFRKLPRFSPDQERRFVLQDQTNLPDVIYIQIPEAYKFFAIVSGG